MPTLLLELFSEEIPSRMQRGAAEQLERVVVEGLKKQLLTHGAVKTFVSPRHLALQIADLPAVQPDVKEERKGPKIGAPEQAMKGFLGATGLTVDQCEQRDGYYFATIERKGRPTSEVLKEICTAALADFSWPKSMRWGAHSLNWVRPLHAITCLLDDKIIPVTLGHITASNVTYGHRFLAPQAITIAHAEQYEPLLTAANVMVNRAARRATIAEGVTALAKKHNLTVIDDEALLDEVTGLVEHPVPLLGEFEASFLDLPPEVLISEMKTHQRYFALQDASGKLTNHFITVANMVTADGGNQVIAGNSRVVRARLSDGAFYWEQDQKTKLEDWGKKLADVVFHAKVGMMDEKVARIEKLALSIAQEVGFSDTNAVKRAALLAKADLTSGMVGEFPELQGIMGRYYALAQGEKPEVADAIRDHYKPLGANDFAPDSALASIVALADKLDSIVSLFAAGEKPTGSKDPLALRRAALGILTIMHKQGWNLDLAKFAPTDVLDFFRDRLKQVLRDEGIRHDVIDATLISGSATCIPGALTAQAHALNQWLTTPEGSATLAAIKRVLNILAAEEKKAKTQFAPRLAAQWETPAEQALAQIAGSKFATIADLVPLTKPINDFFDAVLVNEPTHREARLGLLATLRGATTPLVDFSKIEG